MTRVAASKAAKIRRTPIPLQCGPAAATPPTRPTMAEVTTLYAASHDLALLEPAAVAAKVARHSVCDVCGDCTGLRPADGVQVIIDDSHEGFALRLDQAPIEHPDYYLATCACGHGVREHGNGDDVASQELTRRAKVAIRIDELLQVRGCSQCV
ncbi:hypothetical protein EXIGLDRAFT_685452 [Exidia glandulosa HHB12029]|uniref:Uncharacterized protein n=1 Tax=Exidia glandulosa HHB12029 TaxID=1314781 RepID=A0A165C641_EXIGL|nr:hypothetical protein EXIGLDRAFT_685452 [Exidia glandulosa HHB12029]